MEIVVGCGVDAKSCEQWMVWVGERHEVGGAVDGAAGADFPTVVFEECLEAEADAEDRDGAYRRPDEVHHAAGFAGVTRSWGETNEGGFLGQELLSQ